MSIHCKQCRYPAKCTFSRRKAFLLQQPSPPRCNRGPTAADITTYRSTFGFSYDESAVWRAGADHSQQKLLSPATYDGRSTEAPRKVVAPPDRASAGAPRSIRSQLVPRAKGRLSFPHTPFLTADDPARYRPRHNGRSQTVIRSIGVSVVD